MTVHSVNKDCCTSFNFFTHLMSILHDISVTLYEINSALDSRFMSNEGQSYLIVWFICILEFLYVF